MRGKARAQMFEKEVSEKFSSNRRGVPPTGLHSNQGRAEKSREGKGARQTDGSWRRGIDNKRF